MTWIVSTLLTSLASILIAAPFIWRYAALHSAKEPTPESAKTGSHHLKPSRAAFSVTSGLVVFSCVAIYMLSRGQETSGNTSLPRLSTLSLTSQSATPAGTSFPQTSTTNQAVEQLQKFVSGESGATSPRTSNSGLPPVDELIDRLNARLQKSPKDISGWRTLGWSQFNLQHYNDAAATYAKAIEIFPNIADLYSLRGEALVQAANGTVTLESKQAFGEALKIDAKDLRARFFNGIAMAQAGDKASALDILIDVANDAGANETTLPTLRQRIADLGKELNVDANQRLKKPIDVSAINPPARPRDRDIAATSTIPPGQPNSRDRDISATAAIPGGDSKGDDSRPSANDQTAMIKGMVENLAKRLNESPRDVDGWIMLVRSKLVLNDPQGARDVFARALKIFDQGSPDHDHLVTAAKELGLNP